VVFALANNTDDQLDRLIVAPHYRIVSSGCCGPISACRASATITPSTGDRPERQAERGPRTSSLSRSIPAPSSPLSRNAHR